MDTLQTAYFVVLFLYVVQFFYSRRTRVSWLLILTAVTLHAISSFGWQSLFFLVTIGSISTVVELISLKTKFNFFGIPYRYNLKNQYFPSGIVLGGVYPLEVTAAWILLKYLSFYLVTILSLSFGINGIFKIILGGVSLVSLDFLIDPYAVLQNVWKWKKPGKLFGIPWQNFVGWFFLGLILSFFFQHMELITPHNPLMTVPVLAVWGVFPLALSPALFTKDKLQSIIANIPVLLFIVFGLMTLFM